MILSINATAQTIIINDLEDKLISRNDVRIDKDSPAPFDGVLVEIPDYREDALNEALLNSCNRELEYIKENKSICNECGDYDLSDIGKTLLAGLAIGFAGFILVTGGR